MNQSSLPPPAARSFAIANLIGAIGPFIAVIVLMVVLRIAAGENFWSAFNLRLILSQTTIVAIASCGMTMIIVSGGIDLSIGSVVALTGVLGALTLNAGWPPVVAIAVAMLSGGLIGALNGLMIAGFRMAPFIVTLGMMGIARGVAKILAHSQSVNIRHSWLDRLMQPFPHPDDPDWLKALVVAPGVWIAVVIAVVMALVMSRAVFGRYCYAIGSNEAGARLCGIRVGWTKIMIYSLAGTLVGVAGLLEMSMLHLGDSTTATGRELDVIAAVVIGGASLSGGTGTILGTMIGALIMAILRNGTQQLEWPSPTQEILIGVVIIIAVGIDQLRSRRSS
jgi:ribose transport system permease protein